MSLQVATITTYMAMVVLHHDGGRVDMVDGGKPEEFLQTSAGSPSLQC